MSALALELIRENIAKHKRGEDATVLDLGNCGMEEVPEEIGECVWLEELVLSNGWWKIGLENDEWEFIESHNKGKANQLKKLPRNLLLLTKLKKLVIPSTEVTDLSPLTNLTALTTLDCNSTKVTDLSPLTNLTVLTTLNFSSTEVTDLSPLANLTALTTLNFSSTEVTDLSPLANLTTLTTLNFSSTEVTDLSSLANLIALTTLYCSSTEVTDLSSLANLTALTTLSCDSTKVTDWSPLTNLTVLMTLDFSSTEVTDLSPFANFTALTTLNCNSTKVTDLSPLANLTALTTLNCDSTKVTDLSPLANLNNLMRLDCDSTQVIDLSPLANLIALTTLYCSFTEVTDLSPLTNLTALTTLYCSSTKVTDLSPLTNLTALITLNVSSTEVTDLSPLTNLTALITLNVSSTEVTDLSSLANLPVLTTLRCNHTPVADLSPLTNLTTLVRLYCSNTQVADLSPLANLGSLKSINCSYSQVVDLTSILKLIDNGVFVKSKNFSSKGIFIDGCPLICPPIEVAQESPQAVRDYFEELGEDGKKLNEVKVIFLGEASAGKTSLVKRLMGIKFDSKESQTHGIRIQKFLFTMADGDIVTAHLWDFGGQEVMHATHQFFLSRRCVYVLLLNSRNDDQAEKWLKHAASFGGNSPVLVVLNKIDENPSFEVNRKTLVGKYPQIREFFRLSAKTDTGIDDFREALRREIDKADTRRTPFPEHWLAVKDHFSKMKEDYDFIESTQYQNVCDSMGVTRQFSQDVLLQFLHDLGVVINFRNLKNFDTQILNPLWLTNGVYRIINSEIVAKKGGLLQENDFNDVINDPRYKKENTTEKVFQYPKEKLQYIVRVMQEFELCFALDAQTYVVPQLLPVQEPDFHAEGAMVKFEVHFPDFMPDSIFPRLMVKLHTFIEGDQRWRTGMVLHKPIIFKALARVRWDKEDQKILVDVCGEDRRRFLSFIRETVKEIVQDFTNLGFSELVPIPNTQEFMPYEGLVEAEKAGEKEIFVWQAKKKLSVSELLDGVEESKMRDEVEQLPIKAFVSYAKIDLEYLKDLRSALSPLMRLQKLQFWDDRDIEAGGEWEQVIFQQLEESDIVLCLVSADFVASDFCYKKEFEVALEAHRKGKKTIIPILLRKTDWKDLPLSAIQGVPKTWITSATNKDEAWAEVCEALRPALESAKQRKKESIEKRKGDGMR